MNQPQKHPSNPSLPRGAKGRPDDYGDQFYDSVIEDQGKFRIGPVSLDEDSKKWPDVKATIWRPAYGESTDGLRWLKPEMGLVEHPGSTQNDLVKILPDPFGIINLKVIRENEDSAPLTSLCNKSSNRSECALRYI